MWVYVFIFLFLYFCKIEVALRYTPISIGIAERINGIIKNEYLHCYEVDTIKDAKQLLTEVVALYNTERLHMSIGYQTPEYVHQNKIKMNKVWKNYRAIKMLDVKVV